jgi:hypothetical protein
LCTNNINQIEHILIDSGVSGPTLLMISGTHGNEPAGSFGLEKFINSDAKIKKGKLVIIPRVNKLGLFFNTRWGYNGVIPIDYNREYPNKSNELAGDYINRQIIEYIKKSDFIIDFHEGWGFNIIEPESMGSGIYPSDTEIAKSIGQNVLNKLNDTINDSKKKFTINFDSPRISNTLDSYCNIIGKNYILIETSGQNNIQPIDLRINQVLLTIDTILEELKMI